MREDQALRPDMPELRNAAADRACVKITRGLIEEYINGLRRKQHPFDSRKTYRRALQLFCDSLPESMEVDGSTLLRWRKELLEKGYAARTINVSVSVVNSFLNWLGHREFQLTDRLELEESEPSDITRAEYLRLLRAAREQGKERAYLWIKLFAATGIQIQALRYVTVEAVTDGYTVLRSNGAEQEVRLERRSRRPDRRHRCDSKAVSGGRSAGGAGQPPQPAAALSNHPPRDILQFGAAGGAGDQHTVGDGSPATSP